MHLGFAWEAFWSLSASRPLGFGTMGAIPFSEMRALADEYGLEGEHRDDFLFYLRTLDAIYREALNEKRSHARPAN